MSYELSYSLLRQREEEMRQRAQIENQKMQEAQSRHNDLIRTRANEIYQRQQFEADKAKFQSENSFREEELRQKGAWDRTYYEGSVKLQTEASRQQSGYNIERLRQCGETERVNLNNLSAKELEIIRQKNETERAEIDASTRVWIEQVKAKNALDLVSENYHNKMTETFLDFGLSLFQRILDENSAVATSLIRHLEKQTDSRNDCLKMIVAGLIAKYTVTQNADMVNIVDEVLRQWKAT